MSCFLPPDTRIQTPRLALRNARRIRWILGRLRPANARQRELLDALNTTVLRRGPGRDDWLTEPGVRAWLSAADEAVALDQRRQNDLVLFDRVAAGSHLAEVAPHGRIDRHFRKRVAALVRRLADDLFARLPGLLLFQTPLDRDFGPFPLELSPDAEEARVAGELHVGLPAPLTLRLPHGTSVLLTAGGVLFTCRGRGPRIQARERIPGTEIIVGRRLVPSRTGRRPGPMVLGLPGRLARALSLLRAVWEHGYREVLAWTRIVVPLYERGTVSFSQPDRPGVSYIRIPGKSLIDLADDLLHETAHHRLHALEEEGPLTRDDEEPTCYSPWRRAIRPLRGILHATYTFSYRAQLLARLANAAGPLPRSWIHRELKAERIALNACLADLAIANERGFLTPAGARLLRSLMKRKPWLHRT